ncbi:MAG: GNAT family N-acetyltransferase [Promethearchaeota archaeon]
MDPLLLNLPETLSTPRLLIRKYRAGDGPAIYALLERNENRAFLFPNVEEVATLQTVEAAELKARRHAAEWESRKRFVMGIWTKTTTSYIGELWIEPQNWEVPSFELGWFLDKGAQGKGLATEATQLSLDFIFHHLHAHKIIVITRDTNHRSIKLAERIGFKREGHFREARIEKGERYGLVYFGLLASEYSKTRSG